MNTKEKLKILRLNGSYELEPILTMSFSQAIAHLLKVIVDTKEIIDFFDNQRYFKYPDQFWSEFVDDITNKTKHNLMVMYLLRNRICEEYIDKKSV